MKCANHLRLGLVLVALAAAGCGDKPADPKGTDPKGAGPKGTDKTGTGHSGGDDHHGTGPNGGVIFDLGKYHAEFTVNHDKKECYVLFVKGDDKDATPLPVAVGALTLSTKPTKTKDGKAVPALTIGLKPTDAKDGKASKLVGTDPGLGNVADFEGTVAGEIDGKPASGEFKE